MNNESLFEQGQRKGGFRYPNNRNYVCEWCGTKFLNIKGVGETEPNQLQALGWCGKCQTDSWSKPVQNT